MRRTQMLWLRFTAWLTGAVICGAIDHFRHSSIFLAAYSLLTAAIVIIASRKQRLRNYRFEFVGPGVVRSALGFEVRASGARLEYIEGGHVISWQASSPNAAIGTFSLSEQGISGWDAPFAAEPMDSKKKREVAKAVASALMYLQLVDAGKIRPKRNN